MTFQPFKEIDKPTDRRTFRVMRVISILSIESERCVKKRRHETLMNALGCRGNKTFALSLAPHRTQSSPAKSVQSRDPMPASHLTFLTRLLANHIGQRADKIGGGKFHFHAPIGAPVKENGPRYKNQQNIFPFFGVGGWEYSLPSIRF